MTAEMIAVMADLRQRARKEPPGVIAAALCHLFPDLQHAQGIDPWEPSLLDEWAMSEAAPSGSRSNVRFLLSVWSGADPGPWKVGEFRLADLQHFDWHGLAVFQAWAADPFWL